VYKRQSIFSFESGDWNSFLKPWTEELSQNKWSAIGDPNFTNYNPPYLYLLLLASSQKTIPTIFAVKAISVFFELLLATAVGQIVFNKYQNQRLWLISIIATLLVPTIFLNSSAWAQSDALWASMLILSLLMLVQNKPKLSIVSFAIALGFKLQAVFFAPVLLIAWIKKKLSLFDFFLIAPIYTLLLLPSVIAGRGWQKVFSVYLNQERFYQDLTRNAPTFFAFFNNQDYEVYKNFGYFLAVAIILIIVFFIVQSKRKLDNSLLVMLTFYFGLIIPFFLPKMHERYFFLADSIAIAYLFYFPKRFMASFLVCLSSFIAYAPFLFGKQNLWLEQNTFIMLIAIVFTTKHLVEELKLEDFFKTNENI
jgi:Gpi18-like mannosyltransferase